METKIELKIDLDSIIKEMKYGDSMELLEIVFDLLCSTDQHNFIAERIGILDKDEAIELLEKIAEE